jgi:hypothetical protein
MREIKFKFWDKRLKKFVFNTPNYIMVNNITSYQQDYDFLQFTGLKDKNGKEIYYDSDIFKFKFLAELHKPIDLIGIFRFNEDELRAEIDIFNNDNYSCLFFISNGQFYGFEIIGTEQENPELLEQGNE